MKLQKKITLVIDAAIVMIFLLLVVVLSTISLNSYLKLESQEVEKNAQQAINAIDREVYSQAKINSDWAEWDDTYQYLKDQNQEYIISNFDSSTFTRLQLNDVLFVDMAGSIVFSSGYDLINDMQTPVSGSWAGKVLEMHNAGSGEIAGITKIDNKIALITANPILKSDGTGPQNGLLVMMRYLDQSQIAEISQITGLKMELMPMDSASLAEFFTTSGELKSIIIKPVNSSVVQGYSIMDDIYGEPLFLLKIGVERKVYRQGLKTILSLFIGLVICSIILGVILSLAIDSFFLKRLVLLNREVDLAAKDETNLARIYLPGDDELSELAAKLDGNITILRKNLLEKKGIIAQQELAEAELKANAASLEKLNSLSIGRELKMVEMKKRIEELEKDKKTLGDNQK